MGYADARSIRNFRARGAPDSYGVAAWKKWIAANVKTPVRRESSGGQDRGELEVAKLEQEVRAKTLRNDILEGKMVLRASVDQAVAELCQRIKQRLLAMPEELRETFPQETKIQNAMDAENVVRKVLQEMSNWEFVT